ncbi:MAG: MotA/TolQ/ExbB proton channel family protein, partial [Psychrobacter alimentarius]
RRIIDINAQFETQAGLMIQELYDYELLENTHAAGFNQSRTHTVVNGEGLKHERPMSASN